MKAPDNKGATPIHISAYNSNLDCVKYLFSIFGSSCLIDKDHQNKTCLDNAINAKNILITNFLQGIFFFIFYFFYFLFFSYFLKGKLVDSIWTEIQKNNSEMLENLLKSVKKF